MTAVIDAPPTVRIKGKVGARLRRELLHAFLLIVGAIVLVKGVGILQSMFPFHIWWPTVTAGIIVTVLACRTPDGWTTVTHAAKQAVAHPVHALILAGVVCVPWLRGWVQDAITAGAREAFTGALGLAPHPSIPSPSGVLSWIHAHVGGH